MKRLFFSAAVLLMFAATAQANLLDDGSFDLATNGGNSPASNSAWVFSTNAPDGTDVSAKFNTGFANSENTLDMGADGGTQAPGTGRGLWFRAFEGDQGGVGDPLAQASVTQSVVAPASGDYVLTFRAAKELNFTAAIWDVSLSSNGTGGTDSVDLNAATFTALGNMNVNRTPTSMGGGDEFTLSLTGVTLGDTLTVVGRMVDGVDFGVNPQSAFLDRFSLTVPEPTSLALAGLGVVGLLARRKR